MRWHPDARGRKDAALVSRLAPGSRDGHDGTVFCALALVALMSAAPAPPPATRILLWRVSPRGAVSQDLANVVEDLLTAALRSIPGLQVYRQRELELALQTEAQSERLGGAAQGGSTEGGVAAATQQLGVSELVTAILDDHAEGWNLQLTRVRVSPPDTLARMERVIRRQDLERLASVLDAAAHDLMGVVRPVAPAATPLVSATPTAETPPTSEPAASAAPPAAAPTTSQQDASPRAAWRWLGGVSASAGGVGLLAGALCALVVATVGALVGATLARVSQGDGRHILPYRAEQTLTVTALAALALGLVVVPAAFTLAAGGVALVLFPPPL